VTSISAAAFEGCNEIKSIFITDLEAWCKIVFSDPINEAHQLYLNGELVKSLVIPNGVTSIEGFAFYGCSSLTSVTIPNSVKTIAYEAFSHCSKIKSLTIGSGMRTIRAAFSYCFNLTDVYCLVDKLSNGRIVDDQHLDTDYSAFYNSYIEYATLHVPASAIDAYKNTEPWCHFGEIVALTDDETLNPGDANGDKVVNAADIVEAVNAINGHPSANYNTKNADIDGNGVVNQADINAIVEIIMNLNK
jgi:hypothetical protein